MNTIITIGARIVERPAPVDDADFWRMADAWLTKYPSDNAHDPEMDARFLIVAQRLLPKQYPTKGKRK